MAMRCFCRRRAYWGIHRPYPPDRCAPEMHGLLPGPPAVFFFFRATGAHGDVLQHGLMGKEIEVLEHHTHFLTVKVDVHGFVRQIRTVRSRWRRRLGCSSRFRERRRVDLPEPEGADDGHHLAPGGPPDRSDPAPPRHDETPWSAADGDECVIACRHDASSFRWPRCPWRPDS